MKENKFILIFSTTIIHLMLFLSCNSGPTPIDFGKDQCAYCKMTISNPQFGAELITKKGRVLKYDAAECMIRHLQEDKAPEFSDLLVVTYDDPKILYSVDTLFFIQSVAYRSPMGANLAAFIHEKSFHNDTVKAMTWSQTLDLFLKIKP